MARISEIFAQHKRWFIAGGITLAVLAGLLIWQILFLNWLVLALHRWMLPILVMAVMIALGVVAYMKYREGWDSYAFRKRDGEQKKKTWIVFAAGAGLMFLLAIPAFILANYFYDAKVYESVTVSAAEGDKATLSEYNTRAPFVVAKAQTQNNVTINGEALDTTYIPEEDKFGAPVKRSGWLKGYGQIVWQQVGSTGQSSVDNCTFSDEANRRFGGWLGTSITRPIVRENFGVMVEEEDSYAYCGEDGTPYLVMPLTEYEGFLIPTRVPAGVAIYNGTTGEYEYKDSVEAGEIPGPVYPISLSEDALNSTKAADGVWSWLMNSTGFAVPEGDNTSDFNLRRADGKGDDYVTPLIMNGRGAAITAVGTTSSNSVTVGERNAYTVHMLPQARQGNSAVEEKIKSDHRNLEWATGMKMFEIVPTGPNAWSVTLGQNQSIMYRLELAVDGNSCLFSTSGEKIRCSNETVPETTPGETSTDVTTMTDEQLLELNKQVQAEIERRLKGE